MRTRSIAAVVLIVVATACSREPETHSVLILDAGHDVLLAEDVNAVPGYRVAPADGLLVRAEAYELTTPGNLLPGTPPDAVHLGVDGAMWSAEWSPEKGQALLCAHTLQPINHSAYFRGLRSGSSFVVSVGHQQYADGRLQFFPFWFGQGTVVAPATGVGDEGR